MTNSDEYNGWTNRETWALNLWLTNDQGLYEMTRERAIATWNGETLPEWADTAEEIRRVRVRNAGEAVKAFVEELLDPAEQLMTAENIITILQDVGSLYRVNWDELGSHFLDED